MPQMPALFLIEYFEVRQGCVQNRIPVHQSFAAIDQTFIEKGDKDFPDGIGESFIHGKSFPAPVWRCTHSSQLAGYLVP